MGVRPAARDKLAVPAQQRLGLDREADPGAPRQWATQRSQQPPISRCQPRLSSPPRSIASSWRNTRISSSFERRGRASSQTSANRFRTARYANDQTKQPSLDDDSNAEPSHIDLAGEPGRVYEPYACLRFSIPAVDRLLSCSQAGSQMQPFCGQRSQNRRVVDAPVWAQLLNCYPYAAVARPNERCRGGGVNDSPKPRTL